MIPAVQVAVCIAPEQSVTTVRIVLGVVLGVGQTKFGISQLVTVKVVETPFNPNKAVVG